jgi:fatty acid synthase subunit alpha
MVVKIETTNERPAKVLEGSAEVAQATTVYVFTSQGSQEASIGIDLYNLSPAARAVWDGADALLSVCDFSIVEIVKDNPKEKTIRFGGIKGQAIRQRYMDVTYDTMDKDSNVKTLPLFGDINIRSPKYVHSQKGLDAADTTAELEDKQEAELDLFSRFQALLHAAYTRMGSPLVPARHSS